MRKKAADFYESAAFFMGGIKSNTGLARQAHRHDGAFVFRRSRGNPAAVRNGGLRRNEQAQAQASAQRDSFCIAVFELHKRLEHRAQIRCGNYGAKVFNGNHQLRCIASHAQFDRFILRAVLSRVDQQVRHHLLDPYPVEKSAAVVTKIRMDIAAGEHRGRILDCGAAGAGDVDVLRMHGHPLAHPGPRETQQIVHHTGHQAAAAFNPAQVAGRRVGRLLLMDHQIGGQ